MFPLAMGKHMFHRRYRNNANAERKSHILTLLYSLSNVAQLLNSAHMPYRTTILRIVKIRINLINQMTLILIRFILIPCILIFNP